MDANRTNVELNCWKLNFNSSGGIANPTEVAYALGNAHEGVVHVLLILQADAAGIVVLAQQADEEGKVNAAPAQLYALVGFGGAGDVLQVDVKDAGVVAAVVGEGVAAVAQVVADVQAHAHAGVTVLDVVPDVLGVGVHGHVGAVQVDGQADVILADFLLCIIQQLIVGYSNQNLYTHTPGILEGAVHLGL